MLYIQRGAVFLWVVSLLGVIALCSPIWRASRETLWQTSAWDGHRLVAPSVYKTEVTRVPFWKSDCYQWLKEGDSNLLLLVP